MNATHSHDTMSRAYDSIISVLTPCKLVSKYIPWHCVAKTYFSAQASAPVYINTSPAFPASPAPNKCTYYISTFPSPEKWL